MDERFNALIPLAQEIERASYYPMGRLIDGAPYTMVPQSWVLVKTFMQLIGGGPALKNLILSRKALEPFADPDCGNWMLWTVLNELGVSRERK